MWKSASRILAAALLASQVPPQYPWPPAPDRRPFNNQSAAPWRVTLVEGNRPRSGRMVFLDKFTGRQVQVLLNAGESLEIPPGARYLYYFSQTRNYCYLSFVIQDPQGQYVEYLATVPDRNNPQVVLERTSFHLNKPLDRAMDEESDRAIQAALRLDQGQFVIVQDRFGYR